MHAIRALLIVCLAVAFLTTPAVAEDYKLTIRFGLVLVEPTSDTTSMGQRREFDTASGGEFDFEWVFIPRLGLEVAVLGAADADVELGGDVVAGVSFSTFTLGLNGHVIKNENLDWAIGVVAGSATYGDFEVRNSFTTIDVDQDSVFGLQTYLDIPVKKGGKWGVNVGLKWLSTSVEFDDGSKVDYDPIIGRVMGVYRWSKRS